MVKLIALSGSLRADSLNTKLARAAVEHAPQGVVVEAASIKGIPLYDGDLEAAEGIPQPVTELKDRIAGADGLLLVTPEYNNSMPGAFKNAIDWLSRPPGDIPRVFHRKAVALTGATPGGFGTVQAQRSWLPVLRTLRTRPWFGQLLYVLQANTLFDDSGNLTDEETRERLQSYVSEFAEFVRIGSGS